MLFVRESSNKCHLYLPENWLIYFAKSALSATSAYVASVDKGHDASDTLDDYMLRMAHAIEDLELIPRQ
jgi:hypothetical protein